MRLFSASPEGVSAIPLPAWGLDIASSENLGAPPIHRRAWSRLNQERRPREAARRIAS